VITFISRLSQPLKTLYLLWFVAVLAVVGTIFLEGPVAPVLGAAGAVVLLTGLTLVTNLNHAADALAQSMKDYRPLGVDYSRSWMATPAYAKLFGGLSILVGAGFIVAALIEA